MADNRTVKRRTVDARAIARAVDPYIIRKTHVPGSGELVWRGIWDVATEYFPDDLVRYNDGLWICVSGVTGGVPGIDPAWELVLQDTSGAGSDPSRARWGGWR